MRGGARTGTSADGGSREQQDEAPSSLAHRLRRGAHERARRGEALRCSFFGRSRHGGSFPSQDGARRVIPSAKAARLPPPPAYGSRGYARIGGARFLLTLRFVLQTVGVASFIKYSDRTVHLRR